MPITIMMNVNETNLIEKLKEIASSDSVTSAEDLITAIEESNFPINHSSKKNNKVKKNTKSTEDKSKVKRNTTGYMVFNSENRDAVTEAGKTKLLDGEVYKANQTIKTLGALWSALSQDEKKVWIDKADAINSAKGEPTTQMVEPVKKHSDKKKPNK